MTLQTRYDFTLPRGYVDGQGVVHRTGTMRLATARDELEPLRDPMISGPDDPRLTIVVLARVVERLGTLELVTSHEIENLFAADLAFLQDFYGVINFGSQEEYDELLAAQRDAGAPVTSQPAASPAADRSAGSAGSDGSDGSDRSDGSADPSAAGGSGGSAAVTSAASTASGTQLPATVASVSYARSTRAAIEEIPHDGR